MEIIAWAFRRPWKRKGAQRLDARSKLDGVLAARAQESTMSSPSAQCGLQRQKNAMPQATALRRLFARGGGGSWGLGGGRAPRPRIELRGGGGGADGGTQACRVRAPPTPREG